MDTVLKDIKNKKIPCYFVSPHLDDAVLSAGGLMSELRKYTKVTVINVFTTADKGKNTISSFMALKKMGFKDSTTYFKKRREEDRKVMKALKLNVINLGYTDALWRNKKSPDIISRTLGKFIPEFNRVYPTYRFHIAKGKVSKADQNISGEIKSKLSIIKKGSVVFCPVGVGWHVDHLLVSQICTDMNMKTIYWSDFPYNQTSQIKNNKLKPYISKIGVKEKIKHLKMYKTQIDRMFPNGLIPEMEEIFYI